MPIKRCIKGNRPGFKYGNEGTCYTYTPGDAKSRRQARQKAIQQALAIGGGEMPDE